MSRKYPVHSLLKSPWKATVRLLFPPGFLNFTCLSVHHAMPFFSRGIGLLVPLESIWYSSRVSETKHITFSIVARSKCSIWAAVSFVLCRAFSRSFNDQIRLAERMSSNNPYIAEEKNAKLFTMSHLPLKRLLAMAPHGAMGCPSLVRYGSHSLLGFCKKRTLLNWCKRHLFKYLDIIKAFPRLYRQSRPVTIQLAVIPGLHIASVVLIEVG